MAISPTVRRRLDRPRDDDDRARGAGQPVGSAARRSHPRARAHRAGGVRAARPGGRCVGAREARPPRRVRARPRADGQAPARRDGPLEGAATGVGGLITAGPTSCCWPGSSRGSCSSSPPPTASTRTTACAPPSCSSSRDLYPDPETRGARSTASARRSPRRTWAPGSSARASRRSCRGCCGSSASANCHARRRGGYPRHRDGVQRCRQRARHPRPRRPRDQVLRGLDRARQRR